MLQPYKAGTWYRFELKVDAASDSFSVAIDGKPVLKRAAAAESVKSVERISFRTGEYRLGPPRALDPEKVLTDLPNPDDPLRAATYYIDEVVAEARQ